MEPSQLIVIGGSAGAVTSILEIARNLPPQFLTPICIVIHFHPETRSMLPTLLESASGIRSKHPTTQEVIMPRHIYIAPPDEHMVIQQNRIILHRGPRENHSRPAIDPLFRSAALAFGSNLTAVLLSGYLDDGTAGLIAVKREGGGVIIQDPSDTPHGDMPSNALEFVQPDFIVPLRDITRSLLAMVARPRPRSQPVPLLDLAQEDGGLEPFEGQPSALACPQCNGMLWEIIDDKLFRYRCHEGHAYSPYSLLSGQNEVLENALWKVLRILEEKVVFNQRLLSRAEELNQTLAISSYHQVISSTKDHCLLIRQILKHSPARNP